MIKAKLTGFESAATTLNLAMSRESWNEYVSEKVSLGDDCTISFGMPVDALTGITEHEKLEYAISEINRLKGILETEFRRGLDRGLDSASLIVLDYKWQKGSSNFNQGFMAGKILSMKSDAHAATPNDESSNSPPK